LDEFAYNNKAPLVFPIPKLEPELADRIDAINGLPLGDLLKPALKISGKARHNDVRQSALFEKAQEVVDVETRISSYTAHAVAVTQKKKGFAQKLRRPLTGTGIVRCRDATLRRFVELPCSEIRDGSITTAVFPPGIVGAETVGNPPCILNRVHRNVFSTAQPACRSPV